MNDGIEDRLRCALGYALEVIESYQADIRERGLDSEGFCQGRIYLSAVDRIKRMARGQSPTEPGFRFS